MSVAPLSTSVGTSRRLVALFGMLCLLPTGCALIPTWDDIDAATSTVKDTVSGKARRDWQNKTYAEARIMERRGEYAAAESMYRELLVKQPRSRDCYHRLAVIASMQGKFEDANGLYRAALECGPPTPDLWSDLGYCHYLQQQLPEAEGAFKQALMMQPQHQAATNNLAMVVAEAGRLDEAYALFRQVNDDAEAEANFAYACAHCGDLQRAQQHYSRALSYNPDLRVAAQALLQVTQRLQLQVDQQNQMQVAAAGGAPTDGVQPVGYEQPMNDAANRRMIEVYSAGPRRATPPSEPSEGAVSQLMSAQATGTNPTPATRPYQERPNQPPMTGAGATPGAIPNQPGFPQPQPVGQFPSSAFQAPQPTSIVPQSQPQYLQPTFGPRTAQGTAAGTVGGAATGAAPNAPAFMNAGGPFPPLVGSAPATR